jgi:cytosine/adenosine deaminase-related metal-dependent hydrolase
MSDDSPSRQILRARVVVPLSGPPIENGAVAVEGNRVAALGRADDLERMGGGEVYDLGEVALMPGLINAHCHLDYSMLRYAIAPPSSFIGWVARINALKRSLDNADYLKAINRGFAELKRWGTTGVCNVESFPELMSQMTNPPIRTWWFYEMIDIRHRFTTEDVVAGALSFFQHQPPRLSQFGLSPHAPYTASRMLYRLANSCASAMTMHLTTHVAESRDEAAMFQRGSGGLYDFMRKLGRPMDDCGHGSSFSQLWKHGCIDRRWILAHMNELTDEDFSLLESLPADGRPTIVHCPGSHAYFNHSPFAFRRLHEMGVNICVGTDSLASTHSLSLFEELRQLEAKEPWLTHEKLLRTVTVNPARALRQEDRLGQIVPGALADFIAVPVRGQSGAIYEEIVHCRDPISWMMIDGQVLSA